MSRSFLQKQKLILPAARSVDSERLSPEALPRTVLAQKAAASSKVTFSVGSLLLMTGIQRADPSAFIGTTLKGLPVPGLLR